MSPARTSQAADELEKMRTSSSKRMRERHEDIMVRFRQYAAWGQLDVPDQLRQLRGELMEIKTAEDRVPFYKRSVDGHRLAARVMFVFEKAKGKTREGKTPRWVFDRGEWYMKGDRELGKINAAEIAPAG